MDLALGDLDALATAWRQAPKIVLEELTRFISAATAHLQGEVQQRTPTTHGTLRASIIGQVRELSGGLGVEGVVGTSLAYAAAVELGTKPHMPPVEPLVDWAQQKLGLRGKDAESAAWAIARTIAQRGTLGVGMFHRTWHANLAQIGTGFADCMQRILGRIAEEAGQ